MYTHILVPHDGSSASDRALAHAAGLANCSAARVSVLHAILDFAGDSNLAVPELAEAAHEAYRQRAIAEAEGVLARAAELARELRSRVSTHYLFASEPWRAVIEEAERLGCDLIVMASHGRRGLHALLLGSETLKVLTHCRVPVLVVRA